MNDPSEKHLQKTIAGQAVKFLKRTWRQRIRIRESAKAWHKEKLADNLRAAGLATEEILERLAVYDARAVLSPQQYGDYLMDGPGLEEALELALAQEPDGSAIADAMSDDERQEVVAEIWGITLEPAADPPTPAAETAAPPAK